MNAIFYKEWIKTRYFSLLALLTTLGFTGYAMLRLNRVIHLKSIEHIWEVMLSRDAIFIEMLEYVPLIVGILFAIVQFAPEMHRKCLKLTLHLPYSQTRMINEMLLFGFLVLAGCFATNYIVMFVVLQNLFAPELYSRILLTAAPWYLAGIASYMLASWITLEPTWKMRVFNTFVSCLLLKIFFMGSAPEAYNGFLPLLTICTLLTASFSTLSMVRFVEGKQD